MRPPQRAPAPPHGARWRKRDLLSNVILPALIAILLVRRVVLEASGVAFGPARTAPQRARLQPARRGGAISVADDDEPVPFGDEPPEEAVLSPEDRKKLTFGTAEHERWLLERQPELRRSFGLPPSLPSVTPVPGPALMRSTVGHCVKSKVASVHWIDFCSYRTVKMFIQGNLGVAVHIMGFWKGWLLDPAGAYVAQLFDDGDNCIGFHRRKTRVEFVCRANATEFALVGEVEHSPCNYSLTVAYEPWCRIAGRPAAEVDA